MTRKLGGDPVPAGVVEVPPRRSPWPAIHPRVRAALAALAGPALIVVSVLVVHHRMVFSGYVTDQHIDILPMWLPTHCFLGRSLAAGHVPAWNPHVLSGTPFAADPQSGWTYLPAMVLYTALSCDAAIRWFIVLQPLLAGLGVYGFLRAEEVSRPASTVGGLTLALLMAGSFVGLALPFAGTLAWTAVMLCAAAWSLRARSTPVRLVLVVATAVAWGQIANAHLSHGLVIGTLALATYVIAKVVASAGTRREAGRRAGLIALALPLVNLAVLLPRLAYLPRTTIGLGYPELQRLAGDLAGLDPIPFTRGPAAEVTWPLWLTASPGSYVGAAALALAFAGLIGRRRRVIAIAFAAFGLLCYVLSLGAFAEWVKPLALHLPFGDFYLHEPDRFRHGVLLAVCLLAGLGADAWLIERSWARRALMLAPGVLLWGLVAALFGVVRPEAWVTVLGVLLGAGALVAIARRPRPALAWALPAVLAVEMVAGGLAGQTDAYVRDGVEKPGEYEAFPPLRRPDIDAAAYLEPGAIARKLQGVQGEARYVTLGGQGITRRGYLTLQAPEFWPALANQRAALFGLHDAGGYNPTQLVRYWEFVRKNDPKRLRYNASYFSALTPYVVDRLGIGFVVTPAGAAPPLPGATVVSREAGFVLWRLGPVPDIAKVVSQVDGRGRWTLISEVDEPATLRFRVEINQPGALLVRTPFDEGWRLEHPDRELEVVRIGDVNLSVRLNLKGRRAFTVVYDDPMVGYGVLGSGVAFAGFLGAAGWVAVRDRRRRRREQASADVTAASGGTDPEEPVDTLARDEGGEE